MDQGWTNDQPQVAVHTLNADGMDKIRKRLPPHYNPWYKHYEENEMEAAQHYLIDGGDLVHQIPPEFGTLHHPSPEGTMKFRYYIGSTHGMARSEDDGAYEAAKFNQRLNPHTRRVGNYQVGKLQVSFKESPPGVSSNSDQASTSIRTVDDMKAGVLAHFPSIGGLVTAAPFKASGMAFSMPEINQNSVFFLKFLIYPELTHLLLDHLFTFLESLSNLTRTCQMVRRLVEAEIGYFDTNGRKFHDCEKTPEKLQSMVSQGKRTQEHVNNVRVPKFLIVGPVRYSTVMAPGYDGDPNAFYPPKVWPAGAGAPQTHETLFNELGFRKITGYTTKYQTVSYEVKAHVLQLALKAFSLRGPHYNYLMLSRLDLLNQQTVEAIINHCQNLRGLSIVSCPLIDLGKVRLIIQLVIKINNRRRTANEPLLDLDIAPQFRQGPIGERTGSYGITHSDPTLYNNWNTHVGHALAAQLVSLQRLAEMASIQLCQPGKAFRLWLDKLPLNINQAYNLCVAAANFLDNERTAASYAKEVYPDAEAEPQAKVLMRQFKETVAMDLVIAAEAKPLSASKFHGDGEHTCANCKETLPGAFFRPEVTYRQASRRYCEGCELEFQLEYERGNNQIQTSQLARMLWKNAPSLSLSWLLSNSPVPLRNRQRMILSARMLPTNGCLFRQIDDLSAKRQRIVDVLTTLENWSEKRDWVRVKEAVENEIETLRIRTGAQRAPAPACATEYDWDYRRRAYSLLVGVERGDEHKDRPYENSTRASLQKTFNMLH